MNLSPVLWAVSSKICSSISLERRWSAWTRSRTRDLPRRHAHSWKRSPDAARLRRTSSASPARSLQSCAFLRRQFSRAPAVALSARLGTAALGPVPGPGLAVEQPATRSRRVASLRWPTLFEQCPLVGRAHRTAYSAHDGRDHAWGYCPGGLPP